MPFKIILVGQTVVHFRGLLCIIIDFLCVNYTETVLIHCYTSKKGGKKLSVVSLVVLCLQANTLQNRFLWHVEVLLKFHLSHLLLQTIIVISAEYGCAVASLSVPGSCAPGLPPADQKVSGGVRPAMPHHDGAGL